MAKYLLKAGALSLALLSASPGVAAGTSTFGSKGLILKPLTLTKLSDLSFGSIIPSGSGDLVTISADDGTRTSQSAGLILTDPGFRARFASSGLNNSLVFLQLSPPGDLVDGQGHKLTVTNLTLDQGGLGLRTLTPASQQFFVGIGGTVFIRSNQEEGTYNGTFSLTAVYL